MFLQKKKHPIRALRCTLSIIISRKKGAVCKDIKEEMYKEEKRVPGKKGKESTSVFKQQSSIQKTHTLTDRSRRKLNTHTHTGTQCNASRNHGNGALWTY